VILLVIIAVWSATPALAFINKCQKSIRSTALRIDAEQRRSIKNQKSKIQIKNLLNDLISNGKVNEKEGYYSIKGREEIIGLRKKRERYSQEKIEIAKNIVQIIKVIPWIKLIGITGALAMRNSGQDDDIDLLIITQDNRLWLTRIILVSLLELLGKRRRPNNGNKQKAISNRICLNMWLDESVLSLSKDKQNLFTAHEVVQMKPILNRNYSYEKFINANEWVRKYLPNSLDIKILRYEDIKGKKDKNSQKFLNFSEKISYYLQYKYMKSKMTNEEVNLHFAFFHPQDRTKEILSKFRKV